MLNEVSLTEVSLGDDNIQETEDKGGLSYPCLILDGVSQGTVLVLKSMSSEQGIPLYYKNGDSYVYVFNVDLSLDFLLALSGFKLARLYKCVEEGKQDEIDIRDPEVLSRLMRVF